MAVFTFQIDWTTIAVITELCSVFEPVPTIFKRDELQLKLLPVNLNTNSCNFQPQFRVIGTQEEQQCEH